MRGACARCLPVPCILQRGLAFDLPAWQDARVDIPIPCRCLIPRQTEELFSPGARFEGLEGRVFGRVSLSESSRNRGFSRRLGFLYDPKGYELILEVGGDPAARLVAKARGSNRAPRNEIFTPGGEPAGCIDVQLSRVRVPVRRDRAVFRDASGAELGGVELAAGLTSCTLTFVDRQRGWDYEVDRERDDLIGSQQAEVIDARLLLAWIYLIRFYLEAVEN